MTDEWTTEELAILVLNDRCPIDQGVAARHLARESLRVTKERDDARAANAKLYKTWHQRNEEDTAHARQVTSLRAQRDAALQRGFDLAREHAFISVDDYECCPYITWSAAEAALAKEKQK